MIGFKQNGAFEKTKKFLQEAQKIKQLKTRASIEASAARGVEALQKATPKKTAKKANRKDPDIALFEQELRNLFGVKDVNFKGDMNKGSIEIGFTNKADFDRIYEVLLGNK